MKKMPVGTSVYVEWDDSHVTVGWVSSGDWSRGNIGCRSVGWIYHEDEHTLTVAAHRSPTQHNCPMTIPKAAITRVVRLTIPKQRKAP